MDLVVNASLLKKIFGSCWRCSL